MILERYGRFIVRRRRAVLATALVGFVAAAVASADLPQRLTWEAFVDRDSEAYQGREFLQREFGIGPPNLTLLVRARSESVDDPTVTSEARALVRRLAAEPRVDDVESYWSSGRPPQLRSNRGDQGLVVARIVGNDDAVDKRIREMHGPYRYETPAISVRVGGSAQFLREAVDITNEDVRRAEVLTAPIVLVALLVVFSSVAAATIPLGMAAFAIVGGGAVLWVLSHWVPVSTFGLLITTLLGFGLAIDYSLFIVSRFREELAAGRDTEAAVVNTVQTAGHTILFSAAAVGVALAALLLFPLEMLRSLGYAGMATAGVAGIAALVVLPAALAALGPNVNRATVFNRSVRPADGRGFWYRVAVAVMRRPLSVALAVTGALLLAGVPALRLEAGLIDDRVLGSEAESRAVGDVLRSDFAGREGTPVLVALPGVDARLHERELEVFARKLAVLPQVVRVEGATGSYVRHETRELPPEVAGRYATTGSTYLNVVSDAEPMSAESGDLIENVRRVSSPFDRVQVTGEAANVHDVTDSIVDAVPLALAFIAAASFLALLVQFGSVLIPLTAIVLSTVSVSALFGAFVWVFQDGNLSGLLGFTSTGTTYISLPVVIFCLAFGLSMDYQVFLLSRIKEEYDVSGDNDAAIAFGLGRSGRIVTAAAALIAFVFITMGLIAAHSINQAFGLAVGVVVLLDAFVIRGTLVPAVMKLGGRANWWAPRWFRTARARAGLAGRPAVRMEHSGVE